MTSLSPVLGCSRWVWQNPPSSIIIIIIQVLSEPSFSMGKMLSGAAWTFVFSRILRNCVVWQKLLLHSRKPALKSSNDVFHKDVNWRLFPKNNLSNTRRGGYRNRFIFLITMIECFFKDTVEMTNYVSETWKGPTAAAFNHRLMTGWWSVLPSLGSLESNPHSESGGLGWKQTNKPVRGCSAGAFPSHR